MISTTILWNEREHVLQTLYIPPSLQHVLPNATVESAVPEEVVAFIEKYDLPRLQEMLAFFARGASTRFFNLLSARHTIERALQSYRGDINEWLMGEESNRLAFDFFGEADGPLAGYGILSTDQQSLLFTRTVRVVLQRTPDNSFVLWTAYPLLSPRHDCWLDAYDYQSHAPETRLGQNFYEFLNSYVSVTSDCLLVDAVTHAATEYWRYEPRDRLLALHNTVDQLAPNDLSDADRRHLRYELLARCLDETLLPTYVQNPRLFVNALQHALAAVVKADPPSDLFRNT